MRTTTVLLFLPAFAAACGSDIATPIPSDLGEAPEQVKVGGVELSLNAELWRNFMPGPDPDSRLAGVVWLTAMASIPAGLRVEMLWVVHGDSAWQTVPQIEPAGSERWFFSGGPEWPVGAMVDVVVRIRDARGITWLLAAHDKSIAQAS